MRCHTVCRNPIALLLGLMLLALSLQGQAFVHHQTGEPSMSQCSGCIDSTMAASHCTDQTCGSFPVAICPLAGLAVAPAATLNPRIPHLHGVLNAPPDPQPPRLRA